MVLVSSIFNTVLTHKAGSHLYIDRLEKNIAVEYIYIYPTSAKRNIWSIADRCKFVLVLFLFYYLFNYFGQTR